LQAIVGEGSGDDQRLLVGFERGAKRRWHGNPTLAVDLVFKCGQKNHARSLWMFLVFIFSFGLSKGAIQTPRFLPFAHKFTPKYTLWDIMG